MGSGKPAVLGLGLLRVRVRFRSSTTGHYRAPIHYGYGFSAGAEPSRHPPTVGGFPTAIFMKHSRRRRLAASTGRSVVPRPMRSVSHSMVCSPSTNRLVRRWLKGRGIYRVPVRAFSLSLSNMPLKNAKSSSASSIASLPSRTNAPVYPTTIAP